jgi:hypothetical protein
MTTEQFDGLIQAFLDDKCPAEVLLDAAIEAGYDVDKIGIQMSLRLELFMPGERLLAGVEVTLLRMWNRYGREFPDTKDKKFIFYNVAPATFIQD